MVPVKASLEVIAPAAGTIDRIVVAADETFNPDQVLAPLRQG